MKFKQYNSIRRYIRDKILLPIANRLIDIRPRSIRVIRDGVQYEARYARAQYWYDGEPITIRGILEKRNVYHVSYWDGGEKGTVWCQMLGWGPSMLHINREYCIEDLVSQHLNYVIDMWLKYIVKPSKKPDFTNHTGDDYEQ